MNMRWFLLFVSLVSAELFAKIDPLQWNVIEERGGREYTIHNHNGDKISFLCDMGFMYGSPDSAGSLGLLLSSSNNKKEYNADKNKIVLTIDGEQYPFSNLGSMVGDSWWYAFWQDAADSNANMIDAYVDNEKIATFPLSGLSKLYQQAKMDGCIKRGK
ncbi:hypothetical protein BHM13_002935 [Escherichia coli]|uniref:hypothetical protein n=1 Tax=Escherichia coli TaxID=562 RepID=UPI000F4FFB95|nr:hypothetical protein [Escherichia coli]EAS3955932.1 hypothetical protein [Salmonella enterica]AYZ38574.1 hypothetical protein EGY17_01525 [Escherichia coli]EEG9532616.1 hypothetical protein [Escherichia coli]EEW9234421.1 hypothetical protein [Escherichia coli]EEZ7518518.1 hypothetical protein [Escherichia coli]